MTTAPTLRGYQCDAGAALEAAFFDQGLNRCLIKKPTGVGKTVWFAALMKEFPRLRAWLEQFPPPNRRMLVIAHREELLDQAAEKIRAANPHVVVSIEQGSRKATRFADVVIASIQTLAAPNSKFHRLEALMSRGTFRLVVCDEAHHAAASTYRSAFVRLGFLPQGLSSEDSNIDQATLEDVEKMTTALGEWDQQAPKDRLLVGVTATPNRSDAIGLGCVFQSIAYSYALKQAIADGWLVPIEPWVIETGASLDHVGLNRGDFNQRQLAEAVNSEWRNTLAVSAWHERAFGLPTIAFTVDVAHAYAVAEAFRARGVTAAAVSGKTDKDERRQILADYRAGRITVIANCMILTEGTDLPLTECILHLKPTQSATLYEQMTGRGLRIHPGKTRCVVIDLVDVARRHSLQAAPVLYGLPPGLKTAGQDLREVDRELDDFRTKYPSFDVDGALQQGCTSLAELGARAATFDIWTVQSLGSMAAVATFSWVRMGEAFRLQYPWMDGTETLTVQQDVLGHWDVAVAYRERQGPTGAPVTRQRTLAAQVTTAEEALKLGEAFVTGERSTVTRLADRDAAWRKKPATEGQLRYMAKLRVPVKPGLTSGEASTLIDMAKARGGR